MKVWITKYALTSGIMEREAELSTAKGNDEGEYIVVHPKRGSNQCLTVYGRGDWFTTREEALARCEELRSKKLKSLERQILKIKALRFE